MAKILCTFSGQFGDILWSLPTVRDIAKYAGGGKVDFAIMPAFRSLLPLLNNQSYIGKAFVIEEWVETGRPFGCQPWQSPNFAGREKYDAIDLTYREHPHRLCLADWIHKANGFPNVLQPEDIPFIETIKGSAKIENAYIAYAFNDMYNVQKMLFIETLKQILYDGEHLLPFINVVHEDWQTAAFLIKNAIGFVGCRSANYVLAHGVGQRVVVYEPHPARKGPVFNCPFGREYEVDGVTENTKLMISQWIKEKEHESVQSHAG